MYGHWVLHGNYSSRSKLLQADLAATVQHDIAETHLLGGRNDPIKPQGSHTKDLN